MFDIDDYDRKYYTSELKRNELIENYTQIAESGEYEHPREFKTDLVWEFIHKQKELHGWDADVDEILSRDPIDFIASSVLSYQSYVEKTLGYLLTQGFTIKDVIAGQINHGSFEATLRSLFGEGAIILVNAGMQSLMWQCGKILVNGHVGTTENKQSLYDLPTAADYLLQVVDASVVGDPRYAPRSDFNDPLLMVLASQIANSVSHFIIAHEISHLTEEQVEMHVDQFEIRADSMAMEAVLREVMVSSSADLSRNEVSMNIVYSLAPLLATEVWYLKRVRETIEAGEKTIDYGMYPNDLVRRDNLIKAIVERDGWLELEPYYSRFSNIINTSYKLMEQEVNERLGVEFKDLKISYMREGRQIERNLYSMITFTNPEVDRVLDSTRRMRQKLIGSGLVANINTDLIEHEPL